MSEQNRSYYAVIPANVRYDKNIPANAKLLYGEITALANDKGYCWASNSYFANLYEVSKETISRWISKLEKSGYLQVQIIYKENTKEIIERRIYITGTMQIISEKTYVQSDDKINTSIDEDINTYSQDNQDTIDEDINTPIHKNVKENNTVFNNTINNTLDKEEEEKEKNKTNKYLEKWNSLGLKNIIAITDKRKTMLYARLKEYGEDSFDRCIENIKKSSFLRGENKNSWIITFEWLVRPNNYIKVLEDYYTDNKNKGDSNGYNANNTRYTDRLDKEVRGDAENSKDKETRDWNIRIEKIEFDEDDDYSDVI